MSGYIPHKEDLATNSKLPGMLTADMKAIEAHDADDHRIFNQEVQDRKGADHGLQDAIDKANGHLDKLDAEKATHDDVEELREEMYRIRDDWHNRASHIARGTDVETTKAVVEQILQEKGMI